MREAVTGRGLNSESSRVAPHINFFFRVEVEVEGTTVLLLGGGGGEVYLGFGVKGFGCWNGTGRYGRQAVALGMNGGSV